MSLENVRAFYERLASDEFFRTQMQNVNSKNECSQIVQTAGYNFTQEEFEEYTAELLNSSVTEDALTALDEQELEAVFGGASSLIDSKWPYFQPKYGGVRPPFKPPQIQPMYGIVTPYNV